MDSRVAERHIVTSLTEPLPLCLMSEQSRDLRFRLKVGFELSGTGDLVKFNSG